MLPEGRGGSKGRRAQLPPIPTPCLLPAYSSNPGTCPPCNTRPTRRRTFAVAVALPGASEFLLRYAFLSWPSVDHISGHPMSHQRSVLRHQEFGHLGFVFKIMFPFQPITPWPVQPTLFPTRKFGIMSVLPSLLSLMEERRRNKHGPLSLPRHEPRYMIHAEKGPSNPSPRDYSTSPSKRCETG